MTKEMVFEGRNSGQGTEVRRRKGWKVVRLTWKSKKERRASVLLLRGMGASEAVPESTALVVEWGNR